MRQNSLKAWLLASRPKTLTAAAVPVMVGTSLAVQAAGCEGVRWGAAALCLLFAWVMQIDANLVNDYLDYLHGNDDPATRLGPKRACAEGWISPEAMVRGITVTTLLACAVGLPLTQYGGLRLVWVGVACVAFCFLYTTWCSYRGLGDGLVLVFFGLVPVTLTYHLSMPVGAAFATPAVWMAAVATGLAVDTLLMVNNYRDRDNDRRDGKRTLAVRLGSRGTEQAYLYLGYVADVLVMASLFYLSAPRFPLMPLLLPVPHILLHIHAYSRMRTIHEGSALNAVLATTARNIFVFGILATGAILLTMK